jgi:hypothetical protein
MQAVPVSAHPYVSFPKSLLRFKDIYASKFRRVHILRLMSALAPIMHELLVTEEASYRIWVHVIKYLRHLKFAIFI